MIGRIGQALSVLSLLGPIISAPGPIVPYTAHAQVQPQGKRIALVVGNATYVAPLKPLRTVSADVTQIVAALRTAEFEIFDGRAFENLNYAAFENLLERFFASIQPVDTAFVYYAGHGLQHAGVNYLLPVDFGTGTTINELSSLLDTDAISIDTQVLRALSQRTPATAVLVLDACRSIESLSSDGLARPVLFPPRTGIFFSSVPGFSSLEDSGFGAAFAEHVVEPGITLTELQRRVREAVRKETNGTQNPTDYGTLTQEVLLSRPVLVDFEIDDGDDDVKVVAESQQDSSAWQELVSWLGTRRTSVSLRPGDNSFVVRVHNWKTYTGGIRELGGRQPEGWRYSIRVRNHDGRDLTVISAREDTPSDDGPRHGKEFSAARIVVTLNSQTRAVAVRQAKLFQ